MNKILIILCFIPALLFAETRYNDGYKKAFSEIMQLRLDEATATVNIEKKADPENYYFLYLENYIDFLRLMTGEETSVFYELAGSFDQRYDSVKSLARSPVTVLILTEMNFQCSLIKIKFNDYWSAGLYLYRAHKLSKELEEEYSSYIPGKKMRGIINLIRGTIPDEYRLLIEAIGFDGDINEGLAELEEYNTFVKDDKGKSIEAAVIIAYAYQFFTTDKSKAAEFLKNRFTNNPENPVLRFAYVSALLHNGNTDKVISILAEYKQGGNEQPLYHFDYQMGMAKLYRLDPSADLYFEKFLNEFKGIHFIKSAWQRLGWHYYLLGNDKKYYECIQNVMTQGCSASESDKQALREVEINQKPNKILLRARLLFDGGFYEDAKKMLVENAGKENYMDAVEKLEYFYRLARICDLKGEKSSAIMNYKLVIETGKAIPRYFAPYSALMLGELYEKDGNYNEAAAYFKKCLEINKYEYKNSTEQKAKAGLNRMKKFE